MTTEAINRKTALIEASLPLVTRIARKYDNGSLNIMDILKIGIMGLVKGVNSHQEAENITLTEYLSESIENEIAKYLRRYKRK